MLTYHGRPITPYLFGSMAVCLNIPNFGFVYTDFMIFRNTILVGWSQIHFEKKNTQTLQKHVYSNILKILQPKKEIKKEIKKSDIFHICAQNIDCGYSLEPPRQNIDCGYSLEPPRWCGSNEYPQYLFF